MSREKTMTEVQAEAWGALSHPKRIEIISALREGERSVAKLVDILGTPDAKISKHLSIMKLKGILKSRRDGTTIYYSIAHSKVIDVCMIMRQILTELLNEGAGMAKIIKDDEQRQQPSILLALDESLDIAMPKKHVDMPTPL